jgi:hypothetical protein
MGYELKVQLVSEADSERIDHGALSLKYKVSIPLIAVEQEHYVENDIW